MINSVFNVLSSQKSPLLEYVIHRNFSKICDRRIPSQVGIAVSGFFAFRRLEILWAGGLPTLAASRFKWIPVGVALFNTILTSAAEKFLQTNPEKGVSESLCRGIVFVGKGLESQLSKLLDIASLVSYVAMMSLGLPVTGALGLLGLGLTLLERAGLLPRFIEKILIPTLHLCGLIPLVLSPIGPLVVVLITVWLIETLSAYTGWAPALLQDPTQGAFEIDMKKSPVEVGPEGLKMPFRVNLSSVYARFDANSLDLKDTVHRELESLRSEILDHFLEKKIDASDVQEKEKEALRQQLHANLWHRYQTKFGKELKERKDHSKGLFWKLMQRGVIHNPRKSDLLESQRIPHNIGVDHIRFQSDELADLVYGIHSLYNKRTLSPIVKHLLDQRSVEVIEWLREAHAHLEAFSILDESGDPSPRYFNSVEGSLTTEGLNLFLWEHGILELILQPRDPLMPIAFQELMEK